MRRARGWLARLFAPLVRMRSDREIDAELRSHLELHIDDNIRAGMSPQEARRVAVMKLGGVSVGISDSTGKETRAGLSYVSPSQINFVVPEGLVTGPASLTVNNNTRLSLPYVTSVVAVAPCIKAHPVARLVLPVRSIPTMRGEPEE